jgi:hypothetical protein
MGVHIIRHDPTLGAPSYRQLVDLVNQPMLASLSEDCFLKYANLNDIPVRLEGSLTTAHHRISSGWRKGL